MRKIQKPGKIAEKTASFSPTNEENAHKEAGLCHSSVENLQSHECKCTV